jgi:hypothetical protein
VQRVGQLLHQDRRARPRRSDASAARAILIVQI